MARCLGAPGLLDRSLGGAECRQPELRGLGLIEHVVLRFRRPGKRAAEVVIKIKIKDQLSCKNLM